MGILLCNICLPANDESNWFDIIISAFIIKAAYNKYNSSNGSSSSGSSSIGSSSSGSSSSGSCSGGSSSSSSGDSSTFLCGARDIVLSAADYFDFHYR